MHLLSIPHWSEESYEFSELAEEMVEYTEYFTTSWGVKRGRLIADRKWEVLRAKYPIERIAKYDEMSDNLLGSNTASRVLSSYDSFSASMEQLEYSLEKILLSKARLGNTCELCYWLFEFKGYSINSQ